MLKKRIIPCLDVKDGRTVKGINFVGLRDAGDPVELAEIYAQQGADELVFLDITATQEKRKTMKDMVRNVARAVNIPFTVGGGIASIEDAEVMLQNGADKIAVNSSVVRKPDLINQLSAQFGEQCIVVAIDAKQTDFGWKVFVSGGRKETNLELFSWAQRAEDLGAGEILFTSMNHDGTKNGFALEALGMLNKELSIPVIASGGAGTMQHFKEAFEQNVDACLAASIFHFKEISIPHLKAYLSNHNIQVRNL